MSEEKSTSKEPTPEELEARKKELTTFYKKELPLLRLQKEYEECVTDIEVAKMTRLEIMMAKAQMMNGPRDQAPQDAPTGNKPEEHTRPMNPNDAPKKERSLKAEKND